MELELAPLSNAYYYDEWLWDYLGYCYDYTDINHGDDSEAKCEHSRDGTCVGCTLFDYGICPYCDVNQ